MILSAIGFVVLIACLKLLDETGRPFLCAVAYVAVEFVLGLFFQTAWLALLLSSAVTLAYVAAYFWLLDRYGHSRSLYWTILLIGLFLPAAVRIAWGYATFDLGELDVAMR
ncbi:MAG TPA: hypothetical protein PLP01_12180 [Phycisphaerae bacterium]|nr:hypothetical protein [Phycisphaerae bacterium]HOI56001.1 hypothetical protein [Phycisphaerae bacterium]